ncbi:MAG: PKD domain-containing protein, partial [Candidatus Diapherotrites archaeon]|nr:PKD domain-containing protein [Candidatus Diapherotrites archaeon]
MKPMKFHAIVLIILCLAGFVYADSDIQVTVQPNPFEQGKSTTFEVTTRYAARSLKLRIYKDSTRVFSDRFSSYTYVWYGQDYKGELLAPGTYTYEVVAGCPCKGIKTSGTVTITAPSTPTPTPTPTPSPGPSRPISEEKMSMTTFIQKVARGGAINYAAIPVCPKEGPTGFPEQGVLGYWCKKLNVGSPGEEGAIRYWALIENDPSTSYDNISIEIYIFYAKGVCQNPPQASTVGCRECVLFLQNMWQTQEIPKIVGEYAISALRAYQGAATGPTPTPTPTPSPKATMTLEQFFQANYGCNLPENIGKSMPCRGCDSSKGKWVNPALRRHVICYSKRYGGAKWKIIIHISGTVDGVKCSKNINSVNLVACMKFRKKAGIGFWQNVTEIPVEVGNDAISKLKVYCQAPTRTPTPCPTTGEFQVLVNPNPFEQGKSTTFTVSGTGITQIWVRIYNLTGKLVFDSGWVSGNSYTWNGVANKGSLAGKQLAKGAYIYVIYVKINSETKGPYKGYVYIVKAGEAKQSPEPTTPTPFTPTPSVTPPGITPSPTGTTPPSITTPPAGIECESNEDCFCGDGCYNGVCIHPEITVNGSADQILAYSGKPLETTIIWTIANVGDDAAVLQEITPAGCDGITCSLEIPSDTTLQLAPKNELPLNTLGSIALKKEEQAKTSDSSADVLKFASNENDFKFEFGEVEVDLAWKRVTLAKSFSNPIVVAKPIDMCADRAENQCDMVVVRIRNVQSNSFEIMLQEWGKKIDGVLARPHKVEYLVIEEGQYEVGGLTIEAGKFTATNFASGVHFKADFDQIPVVITSMATYNGPDASVTRNYNPCKEGWVHPQQYISNCSEFGDFVTKIQEQRRKCSLGHSEEEIHYVAISPGTATIGNTIWEVKRVYGVTDEGKDAVFETNFDNVPIVIADMQTTNGDHPAMLRFYNKNRDSIRFIIAEENSGFFGYPSHAPEEVGYIAIAEGEVSGLKAVIETDKDSCSAAPCTIAFDGSKSTGNIVSYEWDFGDGSTASGVQVKHTFNKEGTYKVKLTVTDSSGNTDTAIKTITVSSAAPTPVKGRVIKPGQSIKIKEKLLGLTPGKYELGLTVKYTDLFGAGNKQASEWKKTIVDVASVESDKFHVKLKVQEQNFCIGPNGLFGLTGKAALPKVRFSWKFVGKGAIGIDECDKKESGDFIYCDPTQFAIELAQKLNRINELAKSKKYAEIKNYTSFKAYLIGDNYSENFQKDFAHYYAQGFLEAPSWFTSSSTPWHKYFENPAYLRFEPRDIEGGLYAVTIDFNFKGSEYDFFKEGAPNATITVKFDKLHDIGIDVPDSPFYYLPLNGLVGASGRADYGVGFTNATEPITINVINNTPVNTSAKGGRKQITTHLYREFEEIIEAQSKVLEIDLSNNTMNFYISQP